MEETIKHKAVGSGRGSSVLVAERTMELYWTPERRAGARPVRMPRVALPEHAEAAEPKALGEPGYTPHGLGREGGRGLHLAPRSNGSKAVSSPLAYPYRTCGKLFFTQGATGWVGSGAMISPNILLTAGHCVYKNGFSTNLSFYPSYGSRTAGEPAYTFNYNYVACWTGWSQGSNRAFDYGLVWFDSSPGNQIGWLGTLWNAPTTDRTWDAIGYPATPNPSIDGNTMEQALGRYASSAVSGTVGLTNDTMEHGSSGGPWITDWNEGSRTHANGLQSFRVKDGDATEYGPYLTQEFKGLMDWISNPANRR